MGSMFSSRPLSDAEKAEKVQSMYNRYKIAFRGVKEMSAETVLQRMQANPPLPVVLVDKRGDSERAVSTIPGSITSEEFEARGVPADDKVPVVVYCTIGARSGWYANKFKEPNVYNMPGSLLAWTHVNGPLVVPSTGEPTNRVHVYGKKWDLCPSTYDTTW